MARPNKGTRHVDSLEGNPEALRRLERILQTMYEGKAISKACKELGISPTRFAQIRQQALQGALEALMPRASGRPRKVATTDLEEDLESLRARNAELEREVRELRARAELAVLPFRR